MDYQRYLSDDMWSVPQVDIKTQSLLELNAFYDLQCGKKKDLEALIKSLELEVSVCQSNVELQQKLKRRYERKLEDGIISESETIELQKATASIALAETER